MYKTGKESIYIPNIFFQVEIEQRNREEIREQYQNMEKKATVLQSEKEELIVTMDQAERARKQAEREAGEAHSQCNELAAQTESLNAAKRKLDAELLAIQGDLDETLNEYKGSEERSKAAMNDAARLAEQLRQEQESTQHTERMRKGLELQLKEMQVIVEF